MASHAVQFYDADDFLARAVADYIAAGLQNVGSGLVVATPRHHAALAARLQTQGIDTQALARSGRYVALDAAQTLGRFMRDGLPDPARFAAVIGALVERTAAGRSDLRVFGEMVALLVAEGNHAAALRLEDLWNRLQRRLPFTLLCAYPIHGFSDEAHSRLLARVCDAHARVIPAESFTTIQEPEAQMRTIAALQQKAAWLQAQIREREQVQQQIQDALAAERAARVAAEAAVRARVEFLSLASHELRTPLTSLLGYTQAMRRRLQRGERLTPEQMEKVLALVAGRGDLLARLLNQVLDVSQLEAGTLVLNRDRTDVARLVRDAVAQASGWSERHQIQLDAPQTLPGRVDADRLTRVLLALVENAIRYSPDGGTIEVALRESPPAELEISIRDRGLGIPPEQRARIFQPFFQAHLEDYRSGLGLGLYLSRSIIEMHGGRLDVGFPSDGGLRVDLHLPLAGDAPAR
jgi:signal transduction histidine kinase